MRLTIDGEVYDFDPGKLTNVEGMAIETVTGLMFSEWAEALQKGSMTAQTALVWVVKKRQNPTLRFSEVEFSMDSIEVEQDEADPKDVPSTTAA